MNLGWELLFRMLQVLQFLILVRVVMSWLVSPSTSNPLVEGVRRVTDVILVPLQRIIPPMGGLDLSPMAAIFLLWFLQNLIAQQLYSYY